MPRHQAKLKRESLPRALSSWDDVRLFLAVHRAGSFSAAAGSLGVTQPTCGRRVDALERSLGFRLFDRTPTGLTITVEGAALLEAASAMEYSADMLALQAATRNRTVDGIVRIGTNELFATTFLIGALGQVRAKYPGIRVELALANEDADLLKREVDLAIRFRPEGMRPTPEALVARKLGDEPFFLYGASSYLQRRAAPANPNDLAGHDTIACTVRHPAAEWCAKAYRGSNVVLSTASMQVVAAAIAEGLGIGALPGRASRSFPLLRPLSPVLARGTGWLVVHPDLRRVLRIRVVADEVVRLFRAASAG
ncbi:MAG: LysR family transcriptional regulator [Myxococcota bacterium]|nr:LysR family transcriptional regulator [Myxococcota bacterium]